MGERRGEVCGHGEAVGEVEDGTSKVDGDMRARAGGCAQGRNEGPVEVVGYKEGG